MAYIPSLFCVTNAVEGCQLMIKAKNNNKAIIRNQIIKAARIYQAHLAGKVFLFVYGDQYFEVVFPIDRFLHLTGVESMLSASNFYQKAINKKLTQHQFALTPNHPYRRVKTKLPCLILLPQLTNSLTCVVQDFTTATFTYKIGLTNLKFTLGLTENFDFSGNKINTWLLPRTLRANDNAIANSANAEFVDFIFEKSASASQYSTISFKSDNKVFPKCIYHLLDQSLIDMYCLETSTIK